ASAFAGIDALTTRLEHRLEALAMTPDDQELSAASASSEMARKEEENYRRLPTEPDWMPFLQRQLPARRTIGAAPDVLAVLERHRRLTPEDRCSAPEPIRAVEKIRKAIGRAASRH